MQVAAPSNLYAMKFIVYCWYASLHNAIGQSTETIVMADAAVFYICVCE